MNYEMHGLLGVDAGNISVVDLNYVESMGGDFGDAADALCRKMEIEPGEYQVSIYVDERMKRIFKIRTSGIVVVGDICYLFSASEPSYKSWMPFLEVTNYLSIHNENFTSVDTGGDGEFRVYINLEKVA